MDKMEIIQKYKKEDERLLVAKLLDKINIVEKQNKIQFTDFLTPIELQKLVKILKSIKYKNYVIYGGIETSQRNIIIIFPNKMLEVFENNKFDYNSILNCIRISKNIEKYEHRVYLSGLLKLGLKREKIGDILIHENGADIIVNKDITDFLLANLNSLNRFTKSSIELINLNEIIKKEQEYEKIKIIVSSLRIDNIVSELSKTSRSKAVELLNQERVFINYEVVIKNTKNIIEGDIVNIRGKGKFIIEEIVGNTRNGRFIISVNKFI